MDDDCAPPSSGRVFPILHAIDICVRCEGRVGILEVVGSNPTEREREVNTIKFFVLKSCAKIHRSREQAKHRNGENGRRFQFHVTQSQSF